VGHARLQLSRDPLGGEPEKMKADPWQPILEFTSRVSAEAVGALLEAEGVPTKVTGPHKLVAGFEANFYLAVRESLAHRARWVLSESEFTESELCYLATGKLPDPE
jgi:hypothetical protein